MLITHEREKLFNALIYFSNNVRYLGKTKLFKLLYLLDFEHFKQTGRSVTGLDYFAWKMGPVPVSLYEEIEKPNEDMAARIEFQKRAVRENWKLEIVPQTAFDSSHFSKRELRIMEELAKEYRDAYANKMVEITHLENQPWHKVYEEQGRKQELIPYEYALRRDEEDAMRSLIEENNQVREYLEKG